jgi:hypothetical protein
MMLVAVALALAGGEASSRFLICSSQDSSSGRTIVYVGEPVHGSDDDIPQVKRAFISEVQQRYGILLPYAGCATAVTRKQAKEGFDYATEYPTRHDASVVVVRWSGDRGQDWSSVANESSKEREPAKSVSATSEASTEERPATSTRAKKTNAQADAEFAAAQALYNQKLAEREKQIEDYQRAQNELERQKAGQREAAQRALAAHDAEMAAHQEVLRQHDAQVAAYKAEVAAAADKARLDSGRRNKLGKASTETDANQCVTSAELLQDAAFKGNTAASVVNGCDKPVDIRICLMRDTGRWNCGATWGVHPQGKWSFSSFHATGQVFVDARTSGSSKPLASPN